MIQGQVLNASTGEPLKKAQVMLRPVQLRGDALPYGVTADASGNFTIKDVDPGKYRLMAERTGFVRGEYGARGANHAGAELSLDPGQVLKDVVIRLTPQGVIAGRVLDEDGDPVGDVNVMVMRYAYVRGKRQIMPGGGKATNDLGEYRIHGLAPGRYFVSATYRPMNMATAMRGGISVSGSGAAPVEEGGYVPVYYPNTTDPAAAAPLDIGPGTQLRGIDLVLSKARTARVSGRVINAAGDSAQKHVAVSLMPREAGSLAGFNRNTTAVRDASGKFELRGVVPGSYLLTATLVDANRRYIAKMPVDVSTSNVEGLSLTLMPGTNVTGRVRLDGEGTLDLGTLRVILQPREEGPPGIGGGTASVKSDGAFKVDNLAPDRYSIALYGLPDNFYLKSVRFGDEDVTHAGPDLSRGAGALQILVSAAGGQVDGIVQNDKDQPAAGAMVVLIPDTSLRDQTNLYKTSTTDENGRFTIKGIVPGDYKLFAWEDVEYGAYQDPEFLKPLESRGQAVAIRENGHETVQLKLIATKAD